MAKKETRLIHRTVFLPLELDNKLNDYAFANKTNVGDLMVSLVRIGLDAELASPTREKIKTNS